MVFESSIITLRKMTLGDAELYNAWRNNMEVMRSTNPSLDLYSLEETTAFIEQVILGSHNAGSYIILEKDKNVPIGIVSLINIDYKNRNAECIIDIGEKEYWGKGYGAEGLKLLLDYAFYELNMHRLSLKVFSFNDRAIRLYRKIGFQHEGTSRESLFRAGQWHDIIHMGLLQREYFQRETSAVEEL